MWKVGAELLDSNSVRDKRSGQLLYEIANVLADAIGEDQRQQRHSDQELEEGLLHIVEFAQVCKF